MTLFSNALAKLKDFITFVVKRFVKLWRVWKSSSFKKTANSARQTTVFDIRYNALLVLFSKINKSLEKARLRELLVVTFKDLIEIWLKNFLYCLSIEISVKGYRSFNVFGWYSERKTSSIPTYLLYDSVCDGLQSVTVCSVKHQQSH